MVGGGREEGGGGVGGRGLGKMACHGHCWLVVWWSIGTREKKRDNNASYFLSSNFKVQVENSFL